MMMQKKQGMMAGALLMLLFAGACKGTDDNNVTLDGGKGGSASFRANVFHHSKRIDSAIVYIKYATKDAPENGRYDDSARVVKAAADTVAVFSGLKAGSYYLYGDGWDKVYGEVHGGVPYVLVNDNSNMVVNVPVSEDGH